MSRIAGATVLVTGGASGVGLGVGRRLLEGGARRLVVWDVREDALGDAVSSLSAAGHVVEGSPVDITDLAQVRVALEELGRRGTAIDVLVNNAGVIVGGEFADSRHEDVVRTMAVNALAPMHVAREVLPGMLERRRGHIVNIASAAALVSNPGMAVYCASKWALTGWSDSLRLELERSGSGVRVTTVLPYYIDTGMFAGVRSRVVPILKQERVVQRIVQGVEGDRIFVRVPRVLALVPLLRGLVPTRWFDRIAGEWLGVYHTMDTFVGRRQ